MNPEFITILRKGFLIRGAITCGKLYHTEEKFSNLSTYSI